MQALYSDQHRNLHDGYGLKYETAANHPHLFINFAPVAERAPAPGADGGTRQQRPDRRAAARPRRRRGARRARRRADRPLPALAVRHRAPAHRDRRRGADPGERRGAADLHLPVAVGELRAGGGGLAAGVPGRRRRRRATGPGQVHLGSFHIMGSARMGGSPSTSACDPTGQTWEIRDLYVFDGSSFPTASGVNPQISIQAIAHMGARGLAARLS